METVRTAIDAFNRGDMEAMLKIGYAEEFEYDWSRSMGPNRGIYRGVEGFMEFVNDQWSTFESVTLEAHDFIPRGNHVVVPTTTHGRAAARRFSYRQVSAPLHVRGRSAGADHSVPGPGGSTGGGELRHRGSH